MMEEAKAENEKPIIWFVYDGECPVCQLGTSLFKVRQAIGELHLVDARTEKQHPVMQEVNQAGLDLDKGMVIKYQEKLYQGAEALHLMAHIGSPENNFNRVNHMLFRSQTIARLGYPFMRAARDVALLLKGVGRIHNLKK